MLIAAQSPRDLISANDVLQSREGKLFAGAGVHVLQIEYDLFEDNHRVRTLIKNWPLLTNHVNARPERLKKSIKALQVFESIQEAIHATAVASIIKDQEFGIAPESELCFEPARLDPKSFESYGLVAPFMGLERRARRYGLTSGDIITVSMQVALPEIASEKPLFLPVDFNNEVRHQINNLVRSEEYIVFIAAGNSKLDLDKVQFNVALPGSPVMHESYADRHAQSESILVGYTSGDQSSTLESNFGNVVEFFAPADSVLAACYYPSTHIRQGGLLDAESGGFCRTSAATPILASMAACLQSGYKALTGGSVLSKIQMVEVLRASGKAQLIGECPIGIFPDFRTAVGLVIKMARS